MVPLPGGAGHTTRVGGLNPPPPCRLRHNPTRRKNHDNRYDRQRPQNRYQAKETKRPAGWLDRAGFLQGRVLDYGCGRGGDVERLGCEGYDPYYQPERPVGPFDTIMCNFVLNVVESEDERRAILTRIDTLLAEKGIAYIAVRTDRNSLKGETSIGTWQGLITLGLPKVRTRGRGYVIYYMQKGHSDCSMTTETS